MPPSALWYLPTRRLSPRLGLLQIDTTCEVSLFSPLTGVLRVCVGVSVCRGWDGGGGIWGGFGELRVGWGWGVSVCRG